MSRLGYLARNPKRSLGAMATLLVAAGLTVGSGAFVADQSASEGNAIEGGTADIRVFGSSAPVLSGNECRDQNDAFEEPAGYVHRCNVATIGTAASENKATFQISDMSPGQPVITRCFSVNSDSDIPVAVRLDIDQFSGDSDLAQAINLRLSRQTGSNNNGYTGAGAQSSQFLVTTLANAVTLDPVVADGTAYTQALTNGVRSATSRRALEPGEAYRYCLNADLTNAAVAQPELEGKTVSFDVNVLAQSIYGSALDAQR
jgi:hypothetical protein